MAHGRIPMTAVPFSSELWWKVFHSWVAEKVEPQTKSFFHMPDGSFQHPVHWTGHAKALHSQGCNRPREGGRSLERLLQTERAWISKLPQHRQETR